MVKHDNVHYIGLDGCMHDLLADASIRMAGFRFVPAGRDPIYRRRLRFYC